MLAFNNLTIIWKTSVLSSGLYWGFAFELIFRPCFVALSFFLCVLCVSHGLQKGILNPFSYFRTFQNKTAKKKNNNNKKDLTNEYDNPKPYFKFLEYPTILPESTCGATYMRCRNYETMSNAICSNLILSLPLPPNIITKFYDCYFRCFGFFVFVFLWF